MKKYWAFFRGYLITHFEYRAVPVCWAVIQLVITASGVFLWTAIFRDQTMVGNYDASQMIFYYLLIPLIGSITHVYVSSSLPQRIESGQFSFALLKPYSYALVNLLRQLANKTNEQLFKVPFFLVFFLFFSSALDFHLKGINLLLAFGFSLLAFWLHFWLDYALSLGAFWLTNVWALKHFKLVSIMIFGGMMIPLDLVPAGWKRIFFFLPWQFFYFFPIKIAQGYFSPDEIFSGFIKIVLWSGFFYFLSRHLWRRGLTKYEAYGS
ncbi:MAG: ABC-2 family transporter protein [Candidatus Pacebacteria bacterium]|nr:ABC-2 family transporter protein [Candidatus Paceibacterota bacterium]